MIDPITARANAGLTQVQLAEKAGIGRSTVEIAEKRRLWPRVLSVRKAYADACGVPCPIDRVGNYGQPPS